MKEFKFQYGKSQLEVVVFRPGAIMYLPQKIWLWIQIQVLKRQVLKLRREVKQKAFESELYRLCNEVIDEHNARMVARS
jgi:hypothetical protein